MNVWIVLLSGAVGAALTVLLSKEKRSVLRFLLLCVAYAMLAAFPLVAARMQLVPGRLAFVYDYAKLCASSPAIMLGLSCAITAAAGAAWAVFTHFVHIKRCPVTYWGRGQVWVSSLLSLFALVTFVLAFSAKWYCDIYGNFGVETILYTLLAGVGGVDSRYYHSYLTNCLPKALVVSAVFWAVIWFPALFRVEISGRGGKRQLAAPRKSIQILAACLCFGAVLWYVASILRLPQAISNYVSRSTLYENYYVEPTPERITFPEKKRNLIYMIAESMETTFLSKEQGGTFEIGPIAGLGSLAEENVSFSNTELLGGWPATSGTTWTAASTVAQTAGIPLTWTVAVNTRGITDFLPGAVSIWELLGQQGYYNLFLMGSDKTFASMDQYFVQHGVNEILDYQAAIEQGLFAKEDSSGWGIPDHALFEIAKTKVEELYASGQPFTLSIATIDTHAPDGALCPYCPDTYPNQLENVYACSDRLILGFLEWLKTQPCYEDTVVVICGDHHSMAGEYFSEYYPSVSDFRIYNCIVNSAAAPAQDRNRDFTPMDFFPTTLAAMGCRIDGERLGLGTNLFSEKPTLSEQIGPREYDALLTAGIMEYNDYFMVSH